MLSMSASAKAQTFAKDYEPYLHLFVGLQGGVQNTLNTEHNNWKAFTPTATGLKDVKDQYTVKKYRTREVRELVK